MQKGSRFSKDGGMNESSPITILIVEYANRTALVMKEKLETCGYKVIIADSIEKAIDAINGLVAIHLFLLDIALISKMDETGLVRQISAYDSPLVFLTSHSESNIIEKTEGIPSYGYVDKDSGIAVLDASIKLACRLFTEQKRKESIQQDNFVLAERLKEVLENSVNASYKRNLQTDSYDYMSPVVSAVTGFSLEEVLSFSSEKIASMTHPDDMKEMLALVVDVSDKSKTGKSFQIEYRMKHKDGHYIWILHKFKFTADASGRIVARIGSISDSTEQKTLEIELAQERNLFKSLMNSSSDYIYFKDRDSKFIKANKAVAKYLGLPDPSEMLGKTDFDFYLGEDAKRAFGEDQTILKSGLPLHKEEKMKVANNQDTTWFATEKMPLFDNTGKIVGTFGVSSDITSRKHADDLIKSLLDEKEMILKEVHHRIKNNMNTIQAILTLQAGTLTEPSAIEALEDAGSRVRSMMVLYDKLYRSSDFGSVSMKEYLPALVGEILDNFPKTCLIELKMEVADIELSTKSLQPLGIIVNELLTNIMKYAFKGRANGTITVSIAQQGTVIHVEIGDDGVGLPEGIDFKKPPGFGMVLINGLTQQLKGSIRIDRGNGTKVILEFQKE